MAAVVVHDGAIHPGGAVDVVLETARALDADLVIGISGMDQEWWDERAPNDVRILSRNSKIGTWQDFRNAHRMLSLSLDEYDTVVTSGPATKFFQPYDDQRRVHYLHHPPLAKLWFDGGLFSYVQTLVDRVETITIPTVIANSDLTARRYRNHYGREIDAVIEPPVDTGAFDVRPDREDGRFVMIGRLEERKRPLVAVRAFTELAEGEQANADGTDADGAAPELHLIGDGPLRRKVERAAPDNVVVHGYVERDELVDLVESAYGGVFLAEREDFGIAPIEYMAAGLPVVGVDEPNTNNQVDPGRSGVLVEPTPGSVRDGVQQVLAGDWDRAAIAEDAAQYDPASFREAMRAVVLDE